MAKLRIFATGLSGLVGKKIYEILKNKYYFVPQPLRERIEILDKENLFQKIKSSDADLVLHLAAVTDVDLCEREKSQETKTCLAGRQELRNKEIKGAEIEESLKTEPNNWQENNSCFSVNVIGTKNIVEACLKYKKKLIYISTDFVFDGKKKRFYFEDDLPNPINFYGQTKLMGEKIVQKYLKRFLICRFSYPYGGNHKVKRDFVQKIKEQLKKGHQVLAISDQIFTPTLIEDMANALDALITHKLNGIYHLCGRSSLSPYETALEIANFFRYDIDLIKKINRQDFYKDKALRPQHLQLSNDKLAKDTGYIMKTFSEGLRKL